MRLRLTSSLLIAALAVSSWAQTGWNRYSVEVRNDADAQRLADSDLGIFSCHIHRGRTDIIVGPGEFPKLWSLRMPYRWVGVLPDPRGWDQRPQPATLNYRTQYYNYDQIIGQYEEWRLQNLRYVTRFQIGTSVQGRPIWAYRLFQSTRKRPEEQSFVVNFGIHAREWISPASGLHIFRKLLDGMTTDPAAIKPIIPGTAYYFIPVMNPDGYAYTWSTNRMWRKNRRPNSGGSFGVDLNRNFSKGWGGSGSSSNQSSETYRGTAALSEPESQALVNLVNNISPVAAFIDYHSYGEYVLWAWGYTATASPGETWLRQTGTAMRDGIAGQHAHNYTIGATGPTLYLASGVTPDYMYDRFNAAAYTIELRDKGQFGFILPENQISDTQDEAWQGFRALSQRILDR
ncbi:MAG TPA: M14 family zinc carboxypeptidase [Fimbriimonadaceae bacterium]|nr:hypothetical protein [Armatimonadota bacterium]HRD31286.1 M14 family zinc carboxypeptidase [Fimbriimonadaceae bacterium]HRE93763.1 M14 family zinc carboxypeptidase [Fimbriimonadaceae bacterium]HRI73709.1 M14 family zinc carboxypeptidase [Fimbriimonadaceae bacterium]